MKRAGFAAMAAVMAVMAIWTSACTIKNSDKKMSEIISSKVSSLETKGSEADFSETEVSDRKGSETDETKEDAAVKKETETSRTAKDREAAEPETVSYAANDYESWNALLRENEISKEFAQGLEQFAFESGSQVLKTVEENGVYSPLSLSYALALAGCGAQGQTASEIMEKLGVQKKEELAEQFCKLYRWYTYREEWDKNVYQQYDGEYNSSIRLGNSLWISENLDVKESYQQMAAEKFFASSYGVDFADPQTGKRMGKWISEKTNGVLEPQLSAAPQTLLTIINTLYFYGAWQNSFSESRTMPDMFTLEDGREVSCPFLNRTEESGQFKKEDGCTIAALDTNNHCQMVFFLPDKEKTVGEFLESSELLRKAMDVDNESWTSGKVIWKVPKFSFGSSFYLMGILEAMGMERMFESQAEFGEISTQPLFVSEVIQEAHIGVDEKGVEGAAYTQIAVASGAMITAPLSAEMILDRPFLFGIRDMYNDVWLFLGVCRNPAAAD